MSFDLGENEQNLIFSLSKVLNVTIAFEDFYIHWKERITQTFSAVYFSCDGSDC